MSLDVYLYDTGGDYGPHLLYEANITHNLATMADAAGMYEALWRPYMLHEEYNDDDYPDTLEGRSGEYEFDETHEVKAKQLEGIVQLGLDDMKKRPEHYKQYNSENGWGLYEHFVPWVERYLEAIKEYPEAVVKVGR